VNLLGPDATKGANGPRGCPNIEQDLFCIPLGDPFEQEEAMRTSMLVAIVAFIMGAGVGAWAMSTGFATKVVSVQQTPGIDTQALHHQADPTKLPDRTVRDAF